MLTLATLVEAIDRMHARVAVIRGELNAADRLLGDGDTGMTVAAIIDACAAAASALPEDVGAALSELARATSRASGSSLGAVLAMGLNAAGRTARGRNAIDRDGVVAMLAAAAKIITERSGAKSGDKSILDSLQRIERDLGAAPMAGDGLALSLRAAQAASTEFRDRESRLGRARIYGAKSVGLDDPGMQAVVLLLQAAANATSAAGMASRKTETAGARITR
jgi:phosphoenolpyruvate---glycerone phosphotransferase subunit DhaL